MGGGKGEIEKESNVHDWTCHALHLVPCTLWKNRKPLLRLLIRYMCMHNHILDVIFCLSKKQYIMHVQVWVLTS